MKVRAGSCSPTARKLLSSPIVVFENIELITADVELSDFRFNWELDRPAMAIEKEAALWDGFVDTEHVRENRLNKVITASQRHQSFMSLQSQMKEPGAQ